GPKESQTISAKLDQEKQSRKMQYFRMAECINPAHMLLRPKLRMLLIHRRDKPFALIGLEPMRVRGPVREIKERDESENDRRNSLDQEQPLPAVQPKPPVEAD